MCACVSVTLNINKIWDSKKKILDLEIIDNKYKILLFHQKNLLELI